MRSTTLTLVAGLVGLAGLGAAPAPAAEPATPASSVERSAGERVITVRGRGEVKAPPDSLRIRVAAEEQAETPERAQALASARANRVLAALRDLALPELTLRTEAIELFPVHTPPSEGESPGIAGYRARNAVRVEVSGVAPEKLGELGARVIEAAQRGGANEIGGIELFLADEAGARDRALAEATADAERQAKVLAGAAGLRVVAVESIEVAEGSCVVPIAMRAAESDVAQGPRPPVEPGEITIDADVVARFRFEPDH